MRITYFLVEILNLLASLVDDLLQKVGELLDDGDGLAAGQTDAVHGGGGVVGGPDQGNVKIVRLTVWSRARS